jgi:hypothetical protein
MRALPSLLLIHLITLSSFAQPLHQESFESLEAGSVFSQASWTSKGFNVPWVNGFDQDRARIDNTLSHTGFSSLKIIYPQGQFGPSGTGAQAPLMLPSANQYYSSYWLRFSDNFSWGTSSEGGKLPGLAGGARCSGCATCTGSNGFSARLMWRTEGKAVLYLYHMDKTAACGDDISLQVESGVDFVFQREQWYQIIQRVKVNTGNNFDGEVEVWINQKPALLKKGIRFVNNGDQVDSFYFSTFHGGSSAAWAPSVDSYAWFDDLTISSNPLDVFSPVSLQTQNKFNTQQIALEKGIRIQPQPSKAGDSFKIKYPENSKILALEWLDEKGAILKSDKPVNPENITVPQLEKGSYFLRIYIDKQVVNKKIILKQ